MINFKQQRNQKSVHGNVDDVDSGNNMHRGARAFPSIGKMSKQKKSERMSFNRGLECQDLLQIQHHPPPWAGPDQAPAVWGLHSGAGLRQHHWHRGGQAERRQAGGLLRQPGEHLLVCSQIQVKMMPSFNLLTFSNSWLKDAYQTHLYHLLHLYLQHLQLLQPLRLRPKCHPLTQDQALAQVLVWYWCDNYIHFIWKWNKGRWKIQRSFDFLLWSHLLLFCVCVRLDDIMSPLRQFFIYF